MANFTPYFCQDKIWWENFSNNAGFAVACKSREKTFSPQDINKHNAMDIFRYKKGIFYQKSVKKY